MNDEREAKYDLVVLLMNDELYHVPLEGKLFGSRFNIANCSPPRNVFGLSYRLIITSREGIALGEVFYF